MPATSTRHYSEIVDVEAEILRYLWYEGAATPDDLSSELTRDLGLIDECLEDLIERACIYKYFTPPNDQENAIYCITKRARRVLQHVLSQYGRHKLKAFWISFNREGAVSLASHSHS